MPNNLKLHRITMVTAGLLAGMGLLALLGAGLHWMWLRGGVIGLHPMETPNAGGFVLAGVALLLLQNGRRAWPRVLGLLPALALFTLALVPLLHAVAPSTPLHPPMWLDLSGSHLPFAMTGLALIALFLPRRTSFGVSNWLGLAIADYALLSLIEVLLVPNPDHHPMAVPTILCFLLTGAGLICAQAEADFLRLFSREHALSFLKLRLIIIGLGVPMLLFGLEVLWLLPLLPQAHDFISLTPVLLSLFMLGGFTLSLHRMEEIDRKRQTAEYSRDILLAQLQQQAANLEMQVYERTRSLIESTQRLQLALRASNSSVWDRDLITGKLHWDERQFALCSLQPAEFDGRYEKWLSLVHPDDRDRVSQTEKKLQAEGDFADYEFRVLRADGSVRHVKTHIVVQRDTTGKAVRMVGMNRDVTADREHESTIIALNQRLQFVLNSSGYGVWEFDYVKDAMFWDDQLLKLYGLTRENLRGGVKDWHDRVHHADLPAVRAGQAEVLSSSQNQITQQFRIIRPDWVIRHIEARSYIVRNETGQPVRIIGFDADVTEARELREQLRIAEERWKLALSGSNDAVWDWNFTTGEVYRDERYAAIIGYSPEEIGTKPHLWRERGHPEDIGKIDTAINDHLEGRTPVYHCEYRLRHRAGHWVWILGRGKVVSRDAQGRPLRMVGTQADITPRKQLEEKLSHGEEMFLQLSRLAQIGAWEWNIDSGRLAWSPEMFRLHEVELGYEPTLHKALEFYSPAAQQTLEESISHSVRAGTSFDHELPFTTAQGRALFVRVLARAEVKDGRTIRIYGAFQDITDRRDAEQMRRKLESQLFQAQKMETLGTLSGGIAHDFNNLLTGILGYQELALETIPAENLAHSCLTAAREASLRARELVDQILTFSRQTGSEKVPTNLTQVVEDARRFLRATVPATIKIEVALASDCGRVLADAAQIHQVLLNLGSNAAHAMRATGGTINLTLNPVELDEALSVSLGNLAPGPYLRLTFADTGHGIDEETRKRIFDPFFTTKEVGQGTGLGLSVVHGIIEAHHGTITVESAPGKGATFILYLPVAEVEYDETIPAETALALGKGELIAVIDDDDTVCRIVQMTLDKAGFRVVLFDTPSQCLEALRRNPGDYALLLTDQTMPVMKGIELAAEVRNFAPDLRVLIMSGYFSRISPDKLAQIGHVSLLPKPFTNTELIQAIHRAIE